MMANSKDLIVLVDKEMVSTKTFNLGLEQSFNANTWGRTGCVLGVGTITINTQTEFTFNNVVISLPTTHVSNLDGSSQTLDAIEVTVGSIVKSIAIGTTETISAQFNVTTTTGSMYMGSSPYNAGTGTTISYDYFIRDTEVSGIDYTTGAGTVGLDLFTVTNIDGTNYELRPIAQSSSVLPLFTKIQNNNLYSQFNTLPTDSVASVGLVNANGYNREWEAQCTRVNSGEILVDFIQRGATGDVIPPINKSGLLGTANQSTHLFLQYKYVNNVISDVTIEDYTTVTGNPSLPADYVQQRILSYRNTISGGVPEFHQSGNYISLQNSQEHTIAASSNSVIQFEAPQTPCLIQLSAYFENYASMNVTVAQPAPAQAALRGGYSYFSGNGELILTNNELSTSAIVGCAGYHDIALSTKVKGIIL